MNERDELFERLLDQHLQRRSPSLQHLDETDRSDAESLFSVADLLWEGAQKAPPLEADPIAARLGLIPDLTSSLDPRALSRATKKSGLSPSGLAERLAARGWDVKTGDIFKWQTKESTDVPPALIRAIAELIGSSVRELTVDRSSSSSRGAIQAVVGTPKFKELARRWAHTQRTSVDAAVAALSAKLEASVFRGVRPDDDELINLLEALVDALEAGDSDEDVT